MTTEFDKAKVLNRVKKMMALANDAAASEGERDNALRMAHATLAKYNLTMSEADAAGKTPEEARLSGDVTLKTDSPWMRTIAYGAAKLFFCTMFVTRTRDGIKYVYVGKESNVYTAKEMSQYLINSVRTEGQRYAKSIGESANGNARRSFCKGAAGRIYQRCLDIQRAAEAVPKEPGTSLVLASVYKMELTANADYIKTQMGISLRTAASRERNTSLDSHNAGREYGNRVGLNTQLGGGSKSSAKLIK